MASTDAMAVWDTQKTFSGMSNFGGFIPLGDFFGVEKVVSGILASYAQAGAPLGEIVRNFSSPLDIGVGMVRQAHLVQAETTLALQKVLWVEFVPNVDLEKFISDLKSGRL